MNKATRHELKMLKFKKRLANLRLTNVPGNFYAYRSHGKSCSCALCSQGKAKVNGEKKKAYKAIKFELEN